MSQDYSLSLDGSLPLDDSLPLKYALGTFSVAGAPAFPGIVMGDSALALQALLPLCRNLGKPLYAVSSMLEMLDHWDQNQPALDAVVQDLQADLNSVTPNLPWVSLAHLRVHAPIENPRQFFCAGANYRKHVIDLIVDQGRDPGLQNLSKEETRRAAEQAMDERVKHGEPYVFTQPVGSICGPYDDILLQPDVEQPDWELELAVVIGKETFRVSEAEALDYVAGYTIINDISNRELIHRTDMKAIGTDWVMGKGLPTYNPMGPFLVPASQIGDPQQLHVKLSLNGEVMQDEGCSDMIFPVAKLIAYLSSRIRLLPGDILITGSPSGNGSHYGRFLRDGDCLEGEISGIGVMRNRCKAL
ncbi:2-keto-4-pentenoate hydratase/2-oxohepta-3-ene-1,7-dioic acid hydratase in catechol pathway [Marinobacterium mangrovicola]|uniref:2-keto-4-pentenoate hydratase/2-oxohepta-3-ene-1,7-dioic acid hydratase in catechol pathway n=2 Tax=Marinobacterium mangrovicola TaxID=1476959 RepID=A0A4R1GK24_9GAMM|nr:2-keto-4-pentenoate hydratase/2-oxohepta-3-ene-1,7-dioic acid hydratase in catechol pathway [Marinobacterium mangrovicola]